MYLKILKSPSFYKDCFQLFWTVEAHSLYVYGTPRVSGSGMRLPPCRIKPWVVRGLHKTRVSKSSFVGQFRGLRFGRWYQWGPFQWESVTGKKINSLFRDCLLVFHNLSVHNKRSGRLKKIKWQGWWEVFWTPLSGRKSRNGSFLTI